MKHRFVLTALALTLTSLSGVRPASACGGTFCDGNPGPMQMPVDQTGENILFVIGPDTVEAHIQIQYTGDAPHFAWVIPLQGPAMGEPLPTFSVGSQLLFDSLLAATVPTYGYQQSGGCSSPFGGGTGGSSSAGGGAAGSGGTSNGGGPTIVYQATVGSFDVTLLQGGTVDEVMQWLGNNGYQQTPEAMPILATYLSKNYLFAAVKLTNGAGVTEIHPLVVTYRGTKPCVPLELTSIAAVDDTKVRPFFLGNGYAAPTNYMDVTLNDWQLDWLQEGANYDAVVSAAMDSPVVDGHGFVTEYAGPSNVVNVNTVYSPSWSSAPFATIDVTKIVSTLAAQGLMQCGQFGGGSFGGAGGNGNGETCIYQHPLLRGLLNQYLPVPAGLTEGEFYGCLSCNAAMIDMTAWDGAMFAAAMDSRIIAPGQHAQAIVQNNPSLTRLYTTISPAEMTEDPEFVLRNDLPQVSPNHLAQEQIGCGTCSSISLPGEASISIDGSLVWPTWSADMPYVATVSQVPDATSPIVSLVDNGAKIAAELATWNAEHSCGNGGSGVGAGGASSVGAGGQPGVGAGGTTTAGQGGHANTGGASAAGTNSGSGATAGAGASTGSGAMTGSGASTSTGANGGTTASPAAQPSSDGGESACQTSTAPRSIGVWLALGALGFGLGRRRKRAA